MDWFVTCFEFVGTVAFAFSGALTGLHKGMDIFGVCVLGLTTATGGGVIRDVLLGNIPPATFLSPKNALTAIVVSIITFVIYAKFPSSRSHRWREILLLLADSAGLAIFTVCGVETAVDAGYGSNLFLVTFVAVMTGVGGGVLRDIFAGDRPYIFVRHIYACASIVGAFFCGVAWEYTTPDISMTAGFLIVLVIRLCCAKYHLSLPRVAGVTQGQGGDEV